MESANYSTQKAAFGGGGLGASATVEATGLYGSITEFDPELERVEKVAGRLSGIADRFHGPRPQEVGKLADQAESGALIGSLRARRQRLGRALDYIENELGRLERSL